MKNIQPHLDYTPGQIAREGLIPGKYGDSTSKSIYTIDRYIRNGQLRARTIAIGKNKQYIVSGSELLRFIAWLEKFEKFHTKKNTASAPQL